MQVTEFTISKPKIGYLMYKHNYNREERFSYSFDHLFPQHDIDDTLSIFSTDLDTIIPLSDNISIVDTVWDERDKYKAKE